MEKIRVLVADDNKNIAEIIQKEILKNEKYEVIGIANDGQEDYELWGFVKVLNISYQDLFDGIEDKLEELNGQTIEIIANVSFDDYNEENRLNPKKILSKYY